jgi:hypothetical protein
LLNLSNQQYEETLEEQSNKELASILGISYDELCQLEWDVDTNESSQEQITVQMIRYPMQFQIHNNQIHNNQIQIPKVEGKHIFPLNW